MPHEPTLTEVNAQLDRVCRHPLFNNTLRATLLRYLVSIHFAGRYRDFTIPPTGRRVLFEFYTEQAGEETPQLTRGPRAQRKQLLTEETAEQKGKQLLAELHEKLHTYYEELDPQAPDDVVIEIPRGKGTGYEPSCTYRNSADKKASFLPLGNNELAMQHLIDLIPNARKIEDTAVRWHEEDKQSLYPAGIMQQFTQALQQNAELEFRSITGPIVDVEHSKALLTAFAQRPEKLKSWKLHHTAPMMNFLIVYLKDEKEHTDRKAVFFGYGRQTGADALENTAVFFSEEPGLVKEFQRLFGTLKSEDYSRPVALHISDFWISHRYRADVIATFPEWPNEIAQRFDECTGSIRICIAGWSALDTHLPRLERALRRGRSVQIALWKSNSSFVKLRTQGITDASGSLPYVQGTIRHNLDSLNHLAKSHHNLQVIPCQGWGSVSIFWIDDRIYFGVYWTHSGTLQGPYFLVWENSRTGKYLTQQYAKMIGREA